MNTRELAHEINQLWVRCLSRGGGLLPDPCPTDEDVIEVIEQHLKKQENEHDEA